MYGLSREAVEGVAREGLACCVHMELEVCVGGGKVVQAEIIKIALSNRTANCVLLQGVLSLKKSYFQPRYVLLIPTRVESYISRLNSRGLYTPAQIKVAASRIQLYASTSRQRPGFFDSVIPSGTSRRDYFTIAPNTYLNGVLMVCLMI